MTETQKNRLETKKMVLGAILTALVIILQMMGAFVRFGPFSISLVLLPIVIGAATCGVGVGAWLGFVFGIIVLASGDAAAFLAVNAAGTVITVILKGTLCGLLSAVTYKAIENKNRYVAVAAAAVICPVVNTGIFLIGCFLFFMETIASWASAFSAGGSIIYYIVFSLVGGNFLFELGSNIILSPVIVRLLNIKK